MTETSTIKEHLIAAHTPGPWTVAADAAGYWQIEASGDCVACNQFCYAAGSDQTVSDANARLVAAAPDLLEALRSIPDRADQANAEAFSEAMDDWWKETALPAITKAEGRQP